jgi:hypothetical protein
MTSKSSRKTTQGNEPAQPFGSRLPQSLPLTLFLRADIEQEPAAPYQHTAIADIDASPTNRSPTRDARRKGSKRPTTQQSPAVPVHQLKLGLGKWGHGGREAQAPP